MLCSKLTDLVASQDQLGDDVQVVRLALLLLEPADGHLQHLVVGRPEQWHHWHVVVHVQGQAGLREALQTLQLVARHVKMHLLHYILECENIQFCQNIIRRAYQFLCNCFEWKPSTKTYKFHLGREIELVVQ